MTSTLPDLDPENTAADAGMDGGIGEFANAPASGDMQAGLGGFTASQGEDPQEAELNRAIEELRGVLHEDKATEASAASTGPSPASQPANAGVIMNIPVEVQIVLGSTTMSVSELMALRQGSTVSLDRRIGEPVDIVVNGRKIASGEITVLDNDPSRFGIRLTQIVDAAKTA